jgi:Patatin-like phospholipase
VVSLGKPLLAPPPPDAPPDIEAVKAAELDVILGQEAHYDPKDVELWGLALSGGGIRSATFGLGVLQALARHDLLGCFHYQSTVSGGGYIGAFLQGLIRRRGFDEAFTVLRSRLDERPATPDTEPGEAARAAARIRQPIRHLREYSNYLSPRKSPLSGDTLGMVGTYVRNVLLIQLQLCALIVAMTLLPLLLYAAFIGVARAQPVLTPTLAGLLGMLAVALLAYVTTYVNRRPRAPGAMVETPPARIAMAAMATIVLLATASFVGAIGLAHYDRLPALLEAALAPLQLAPVMRLGVASGVLYVLMWVAWLLFDRWQARIAADDMPPSTMQLHIGRFLMSTVGAAIFAGFAIVVVHTVLQQSLVDDHNDWHVMILGPTVVMVAVVLTGILHLGLAGPALSDLQREIWARVGGKTAGLVVLGVTLTLALTVYGPWLLMHSVKLSDAKLSGMGWAGGLAWLSTTGVGLLVGRSAGGSAGVSKRGRLLELVARIAPWVFILGLIVALSLAGQMLIDWHARSSLEPTAQLYSPWQGSLRDHLLWLDLNATMHLDSLIWVTVIALATWLLFGWAVNVNEFSLNAFYRNRLVRCYLGASNDARNPEPTTNFDVQDDLVLADLVEMQRLNGARPLFPLVGTALNLVAAKQLDWQDRKAASFCLSPGFCGYLPPASRSGAPVVGDLYADVAGTAFTGHAGDSLASSLTLGSAIAISGAAVNPNMGYHSSPAVTFLLTLFDARLGWWLPNPCHPMRPQADSTPFFGRWLIAEMLGRTHDGGKYVHLSDGGHFENLGLYELVRRRCRFILSVDAAADPVRGFADLGNAVQKCRVDFGVDINIDVSALRPQADGRSLRSCAVGSIEYPDGSRGTLLYVKPTLTGEEPTDIQHYASAHPSFPHEPTIDQYFDEAQFESYRRLGQDVMSRALEPVLERAGAEVGAVRHDELGVHDSELKEKILIALRHQWAPSIPGGAERFAQHAAAMSRLFGQLRDTPALSVLDAQFYPAWTDLVAADPSVAGTDAAKPIGRRTRMPAAADFRACFYFCQELVRLMESVYHDLDLEHAWNHPDNRGWMNAFRHWSSAPMFRVAWAVGAPTFGARFVAFCEQRLQLPRLDNDDKDHRAVRIEEASPASGTPWAQHCNQLADDGRINHVEHGILLSDAMLSDAAVQPTQLFLLRLRWTTVLSRTGTRIPDTTLGMAVLAGNTLRLLRVQDHVRQLGLGAEFMRLLTDRVPVREITHQLETLRLLAFKRKRARNDSTRGKRIANRQRIRTAHLPAAEHAEGVRTEDQRTEDQRTENRRDD